VTGATVPPPGSDAVALTEDDAGVHHVLPNAVDLVDLTDPIAPA